MTKEMHFSSAEPSPISRPARLTREQSRAQTRERILASAAIVFSREGYGGASVDRIAEEASYSKGAIYSNFASKDVLFTELVEHYSKVDYRQLCERLDAVTTPEDLISTVCAWASELRHEPDLRLLILDMSRRVKGDPVLSERHARLFDEQWHEVGTRLLRIFPDGQAAVSPMMLGALVMELSYGNASHAHVELSAGDLIGVALRALHEAHGRNHPINHLKETA